MLGNTRRGHHRQHLRQLYIACARSIMTFDSTLWWQERGLTKAHGLLEKVQNQALRVICACFRTTPIYALQIEAELPPIQIHLTHIAEREAIRLHRLGKSHPLLLRL